MFWLQIHPLLVAEWFYFLFLYDATAEVEMCRSFYAEKRCHWIVGVFAFIKGKQADFHQRCECVITKTYATVNARTKSMLYFTSYQTYRKSQNHVVCRSFCSCESVGIWSKNGDCHCTLWCLSSIHHGRMLSLSSCSSALNGFKYLDQCFCQTVIHVPELQHV